MKFRAVLEYDPEAESYSAVCPELPGCTSAGETVEEGQPLFPLHASERELPQINDSFVVISNNEAAHHPWLLSEID